MIRISQDRLEGAMYGQAIGDARGIAMEYRSAAFIKSSGHKWGYQDVFRYGKPAWKAGEWSDDTERGIALLDAYLAGREEGRDRNLLPDELICADRLVRWIETDGRGSGGHTISVLTNTFFLVEPFTVSKAAWEESGQQAAPNGAVMGTAYVGLMRPWDLDWTERAAEHCARLTHWDPRCVSGSVAVSILVASLVTCQDLATSIENAISRAEKYDPDARKWLTMSLEELKLDEGLPEDGSMPKGKVSIGFTWKCAGAAFWAARQLDGDPCYLDAAFPGILDAVLSAGGDVDTNGAVAGAVLGAAVGRRNIDLELEKGLLHSERLENLLLRLVPFEEPRP